MDTKLQFSPPTSIVLSLLALALLASSASGADGEVRVLRPARAITTTRATIPAKVIGGTSRVDGTNGFVALQRSDYQVLIGRGTNLTPVKGGVTNVNGRSFAQVPIGIPYYVLPAGTSRIRGTNSVVAAEVGMLTRSGRNITGRLILAQDTLFDYYPDSNDFRTTLRVGWETTNTIAESGELLPVHVRLNTGVFKHDTNFVAIEQPGIPGEKEVLLSASSAYTQRAVKARSSDKNGYALPEVELVIEAEPRSLWSLFGMLVPGRTWVALFIGGTLGSLVRFRRTFRLKRERKGGRPVHRWLDALWFAIEALVLPAVTYILLMAGYITFEKVPWANGLGGALAWGVFVGLVGASIIEMLGLPGSKGPAATSDSAEPSPASPA
jgi:hypothetical protein